MNIEFKTFTELTNEEKAKVIGGISPIDPNFCEACCSGETNHLETFLSNF